MVDRLWQSSKRPVNASAMKMFDRFSCWICYRCTLQNSEEFSKCQGCALSRGISYPTINSSWLCQVASPSDFSFKISAHFFTGKDSVDACFMSLPADVLLRLEIASGFSKNDGDLSGSMILAVNDTSVWGAQRFVIFDKLKRGPWPLRLLLGQPLKMNE